MEVSPLWLDLVRTPPFLPDGPSVSPIFTIDLMTFGLYIHIPFCQRACPYCAHYKEEQTHPEIFRRFIHAVLKEAQREAPHWQGSPLTLFLGGGTPSLLPDALMIELIEGLHKIFPLDRLKEFTVEMNPEHVVPEKLATYQSLGVTRISIGVQSFQPHLLTFLGRTHTPDDLYRALHTLQHSPYKRWNADLMFGMAVQTLEAFREDLVRILSFQPPHLSIYELSVEPGTPFFIQQQKGKIKTAPQERRIAQYLLRETLLQSQGYHRYEISNYAQPGQESLHNLLYWKRRNVLGLGPGASTLRGYVRWTNRYNLIAYLEHIERGEHPPRFVEHLNPSDVLLERVFLGLRLEEGLVLPRSVRKAVLNAFGDFVEMRGQRVALRFPEGVLRVDTLAVEIARLWEEISPPTWKNTPKEIRNDGRMETHPMVG